MRAAVQHVFVGERQERHRVPVNGPRLTALEGKRGLYMLYLLSLLSLFYRYDGIVDMTLSCCSLEAEAAQPESMGSSTAG